MYGVCKPVWSWQREVSRVQMPFILPFPLAFLPEIHKFKLHNSNIIHIFIRLWKHHYYSEKKEEEEREESGGICEGRKVSANGKSLHWWEQRGSFSISEKNAAQVCGGQSGARPAQRFSSSQHSASWDPCPPGSWGWQSWVPRLRFWRQDPWERT